LALATEVQVSVGVREAFVAPFPGESSEALVVGQPTVKLFGCAESTLQLA
jgi:hypothetical protein